MEKNASLDQVSAISSQLMQFIINHHCRQNVEKPGAEQRRSHWKHPLRTLTGAGRGLPLLSLPFWHGTGVPLRQVPLIIFSALRKYEPNFPRLAQLVHLCWCAWVGGASGAQHCTLSTVKLYYIYFYLILSCRTTDTPIVHCRSEQVYGDIYPYFDWITNALYGGVKSIDGLNYEFWMIEVKKNSHNIQRTLHKHALCLCMHVHYCR